MSKTHRVRIAAWVGVSIWAMSGVLSACSTDDRFSSAGGAGGAGGAAAGSGGRAAGSGGRGGRGGGPAAGGGATAELGAACEKDSDCGGGWFCDMEVMRLASVSGAPNGGQIDLSLFPGGSCTPIAIGVYDPMTTCDPLEPAGAQGCTEDGVCVPETIGNDTQVACRRACEPSATATGCTRDGYTCDFGIHACIEGCRSEAECRIQVLDANGDGDPDGTAYDRTSSATCDMATRRCTHEGGSQPTGGSCKRDEDCADDGICITEDASAAGHTFPGGFCTKIGCTVEGRGCGDNSECAPLRPLLDAAATDSICLTKCKVGAEGEDLKLGSSGHGQGCRTGYRCAYNGGVGADSGTCVGGEYNTVTENNVGKLCQQNSECYSPYGLARCLRYGLPNNGASTGTCTILDCSAPGLPDDICGSGNECVFSSADQSFCLHNCKTANDCQSGFACADDDGVPGSPSVCYPVCETDQECRANERCQPFPGQAAGQTFGQCMLQ